MPAGPLNNQDEALGAAVAALCFDDSADYSSTLWSIVRLLGGEEAATLLELDERAAYEKYAQNRQP
jgi:hypothetical protein